MKGAFPIAALALACAFSIGAAPLEAQSLRGSSHSLDIQNGVARAHDFTFIATGNQLRRFVGAGYLVPVRANRDFEVHRVSYPYARPELALFIERLASQYRRGCGEQLVVTSLTRPLNQQPPNASRRSVHPTGMAVDLRRSSSSRCRAWLESVLTSLEREGVLEATRESTPPHYHVALFPTQYTSYVERITKRAVELPEPEPAVVASGGEYRIRMGDTLWSIARMHGTTVARLRGENDLASNRIYAGQVIQIPSSR